MLSKYISLGDRIDIVPVRKAEGDEREKRTYHSQLNDILSEDRLEITMPIEKTKLVLLSLDAEYELYFYASGGTMYNCRVRVTDRYKSKNIYLLAVDLITDLCKYQRREYYRLACSIDMLSRLKTEEELEAEAREKIAVIKHDPDGPALKKGMIVDISGGGCRFVTAEEYEKGDEIYMEFKLSTRRGASKFKASARVLTTAGIENRKGEYEVRAQFHGLNAKEREEIIKFIFEEDRKSRKTEKG